MQKMVDLLGEERGPQALDEVGSAAKFLLWKMSNFLAFSRLLPSLSKYFSQNPKQNDTYLLQVIHT